MTPETFDYLSEKAGDTVLCAHIQPRAAKSELCGTFGGRLKIRVNSPPVEGEANRECIDLLAKTLGVSKSEIRLLRGERSRDKTFVISRPIGFVREKFKAGCRNVPA
jgi:uncharacterized protein (TIGR00251 family)